MINNTMIENHDFFQNSSNFSTCFDFWIFLLQCLRWLWNKFFEMKICLHRRHLRKLKEIKKLINEQIKKSINEETKKSINSSFACDWLIIVVMKSRLVILLIEFWNIWKSDKKLKIDFYFRVFDLITSLLFVWKITKW